MRSLAYLIVGIVCLFYVKTTSSITANNDMTFCVYRNNESVSLEVSTVENLDSNDSATCTCKLQRMESSLKATMTNDGYVHTPGIGSYKLHAKAKTWNEARKICNKEDGHLAVVNSEEERIILTKMLRGYSDRIEGTLITYKALLGFHDLFKNGEWVTIFGDTIDPSDYAASYFSRSYYLGDQHCGTLVAFDGRMNDDSCDYPFAFFCERPISC